MVCIKTCYSFKLTKPFQWAKQNPKIVILWNHLDWYLKAYWPKIAHFSKKYFWALSFFGQKWYEQPQTKRPTLSKRSSYEKRCFKLKVHLWYASLPEVDRPWERKKQKKEKEKLIVMSCTWKIRVESKWKSKESS